MNNAKVVLTALFELAMLAIVGAGLCVAVADHPQHHAGPSTAEVR